MFPRMISILLILQLLVIFFGIMVVGVMLRLQDTHSLQMTGEHLAKNSFHNLRDYGFWLNLLPLGWATAAVYDAHMVAEKKRTGRRYELVGWLIFVGLLLFFLVVSCGLVGWLIFFVLLAVFFLLLWRRK